MKAINQSASAAKFLLGGIATGNISIDQNARLCDYELWNTPNKKFYSPYSFFVVRAEAPGGKTFIKALESQFTAPFERSHGFNAWEIGGLPRFEHSEMTGDYPFVNFRLTDKKMPLEAEIEAFTPFVPLAVDDSSLPGFVLRYKIKNTSSEPLTVSVAGSQANLCNFTHLDIWTKHNFAEGSVNTYVDQGNSRGLLFSGKDKKETDLDYMEMAFLTTEKENISCLSYWNEGAWWDGLQDFWNDFSADGELTDGHKLKGKGNNLHHSGTPIGSLCVKKTIPAGAEASFEFVIGWYRPNRVRAWDQTKEVSETHPIIRNYYAKFGSVLKSMSYMIEQLPRLENESRKFVKALRSGTLPEYVIDAVSATITVIRSSTCFRVEDGTFFGWEGCFDHAGCCDGNCTHVWNYTQTLAFLFPELERSMRRTEFLTETQEDGRMFFRAFQYLGETHLNMPPAADGQFGTIIRLYRDWKLCGDDQFLKDLWPNAKRALEYGAKTWDLDGDGVLEGEQHNTYDIEFYGMSSMINTIFYAALRAGEEISRYLGDKETADRYAAIQKKGAQIVDQETFNGEYYAQKIDDVNEYKYQYGIGCLADQLFGQQLAHVSGLGYVLNPENVKKAVHAIFKRNFVSDFSEHVNLQRTYAINGDGGLLLCSWPNGGRPEIPFVYCDEVWSGIEYQVASHLIYEGFVDEGLQIVKACRERHDGVKRSPWNEVECGHHYARSLASYGVLLALSGFHCDAVNKTISFKPAQTDKSFSCFFSCAAAWGVYHRIVDEKTGDAQSKVDVLYGSLDDYELVADGVSVKIG